MTPVPLLLGLMAAAPLPADRPAEKPPLFLSVGIPAVHDRRVLPLGGSFPVVVTNTSDKPVKVWREWCSWGYYNLSLRLEIGDKDVELVKPPRGWGKNYPDAAELAPGESMVWPVVLDEKSWKDFATLKDQVGRRVRLKVRYHVGPDEDSAKLGVWTGTLQTPNQEYVVEKAP